MMLLYSWALVFALFLVPGVAAHRWLLRRGETDDRLLLAGPLVFIGLAGYATFFLCLFHPWLGRLSSYLAFPVWAWYAARNRPANAPRTWGMVIALTFGIGLFYLALLFLPQLGRAPEWQSQVRFLYEFPSDENLPKLLGDRLYAGESPKPFLPEAGWLSSDRPPLQTGLYLLVRPWTDLLGVSAGWAYTAVGTLAQLCWVPALWLAAARLGLRRCALVGAILLAASSGFLLFNSTYVWPKLLAGGLVLFAGVLLLDRSVPRSQPVVLLASACAALGWLAHGAVAFSLLGLAPFLLVPGWFPGGRNVLLALLVALALAAPWLVYQKVYDPPANRLLKWHLAGVVPIDARSTGETLREAYASASPETLRHNKAENARILFYGSYRSIWDLFSGPSKGRRVDEFFYVFRSLGVLNLAWLLVPLGWIAWRPPAAAMRLFLLILAWTVVTLALWVLLMFGPATTILHQGSYAAVLSLFLLAVAGLLLLPKWLALPVLGWHAFSFAVTWLPYYGSASLDPTMFALLGVAVLVLAATARTARRDDASFP